MKEEWRPVVGFEDYYAISNKGRVKRIAEGPGARAGHILSPSHSPRYPNVTLSRNGMITNKKVHRMVAEAFLGPPPPDHQVNHKNGDRMDNRVENLEWVTGSENQRHSYRVLGRTGNMGENHPCAKLTAKQVRRIREIYAAEPITQEALAMRFGMSKSAVKKIINRERWRHIT